MKKFMLFGLLLVGGLINAAQCEGCFSGKSLDELQAMYDERIKDNQKILEFKKIKIAKQKMHDNQEKFVTAKTQCYAYENTWFVAWYVGATQNDCDLIDLYEKEFIKAGKLHLYAKEQPYKVDPELKAIADCILKREYDAIDISEETV
jgi:hypothetical protein